MRKIWKRSLAYMLAAAICFNAVDVSVYAQESTVKEVIEEEETIKNLGIENEAEIPTISEKLDIEAIHDDYKNEGNQVTTEKVMKGENYKITFSLTSHWDNGYNANVKIENTGDEVIEDWYLKFDYDGMLTNIWNAEISSKESNTYIIKNATWNQDISVGQSVEFGISAGQAFKGFPENLSLIGTCQKVNDDDYTIKYILDKDWEHGFIGSIQITNNTDVLLEDWVLEFDYERQITNIWNGVVSSHEGMHYIIKNADYNSNIQAGGTITIGFEGIGGDSEYKPSNYSLYSYSDKKSINLDEIQVILNSDDMTLCESESGDYYLVEKELTSLSGTTKNIENADEFSFSISDLSGEIKKGILDKNKNWTITDFGLGFGYNKLEIVVTSGKSEKKFIFNLVNTCIKNMENIGIDYTSDTDKDGVSDYLEKKYNLDPNSIDSDGDGLNDYMEFMIPNLSPVGLDGDGNGVYDADEDYDSDGLSNYDEVNVYFTDYSLKDTDSDSLSDFEEVNTYKTNPNSKDSDKDGVNDNVEIAIGSNPLVPNNTFKKTLELSADSTHSTSVKVTVNDLTSAQVTSFVIGRSTDIALTDKNIPGYIDDGYNFVVDGSISGAVVEVSYDISLEEDSNFEPALYYYNDKT